MLSRFGPWPVLALLLSLALPAAPALADQDEAGAQTCERAIVAGARDGGVPEGVLHAVSLTETGRAQNGRLRPWPWAINREGQGYWFRNREEALAFAKASVAAGRTSFDVGCFQINYFWHGRNFPSLEAMFDPETGADYAASFLRSLYQERGDWSAAAGAYHSQQPDRAERLSRALRPHPRGPRRRADHARGGRARGRAGGGARCSAQEPHPADARPEDHQHPAAGPGRAGRRPGPRGGAERRRALPRRRQRKPRRHRGAQPLRPPNHLERIWALSSPLVSKTKSRTSPGSRGQTLV